jgi:ornithine cyclodeaminase/alanine dehydrogenase-like protein (mu-crystallin family)
MNHKNVTGVFAVIDTAAGLPVGCVEKNKQITNCVFRA